MARRFSTLGVPGTTAPVAATLPPSIRKSLGPGAGHRPRADVADYMSKQFKDNRYVHRTPAVLG